MADSGSVSFARSKRGERFAPKTAVPSGVMSEYRMRLLALARVQFRCIGDSDPHIRENVRRVGCTHFSHERFCRFRGYAAQRFAGCVYLMVHLLCFPSHTLLDEFNTRRFSGLLADLTQTDHPCIAAGALHVARSYRLMKLLDDIVRTS